MMGRTGKTWWEDKKRKTQKAKHRLVALLWSFPCSSCGILPVLYPECHILFVWGLLIHSPYGGRGCPLPARSLSGLQCSGGKLGTRKMVTSEYMDPSLCCSAGSLWSWEVLLRSCFKTKQVDFGGATMPKTREDSIKSHCIWCTHVVKDKF